jgi:Domain of unknown function (DUF4191)
MPKDVEPDKLNRRQQFVATYKMAKQTDRHLGLWLLGAFLLGAAIGFGVFWVLPGEGALGLIISIAGGVLTGLLAAVVLFGRRAQRSAYRQLDGRPGAAGQALGLLRRGWKTDAMIAFTKQQDVVHRVVGPPGIVLVGEGNPNRLRGLMTNERRKHERVASEVPIHEVICGDGEGEVPLPRLVKHVSKLGKNVKPAELTDVLSRLKALDANRSSIPMPKGPVPTSMKGLRGQMRGRR